jgi:hypothetical protein
MGGATEALLGELNEAINAAAKANNDRALGLMAARVFATDMAAGRSVAEIIMKVQIDPRNIPVLTADCAGAHMEGWGAERGVGRAVVPTVPGREGEEAALKAAALRAGVARLRGGRRRSGGSRGGAV